MSAAGFAWSPAIPIGQSFATADRLNPRSQRQFSLTGVGIAHFLANRLDQAAAMLLGLIRYCLPM
jgi:hypothetical protein